MADPQKKSRLLGGSSDLYDIGASARKAYGDTLGQMGRSALVGAAPYMLPALAGSQIATGFLGGDRPANADFSGVSTRTIPGPPAATAPAPLNNATPPAAAPTLRPGDSNTFTGANGTTRSVPFEALNNAPPAAPNLRTPSIVVPARSTAPAVQDATSRAVAGTTGAARLVRQDATELLNPMSGAGELMRRFEISQGGYKGSPSARRMAGEALLGQISAQNAASAAGQTGTNAVLQQGLTGEVAAEEGYARRRLDADTANADDSYRRDALSAEQQRPTQQIRDVDGRTSILRNDGTVSTLRDEEGAPIRTAGAEQQANSLSLKDLLDSYNEQAKALAADPTSTPAEKTQALGVLKSDPLYGRLFPQAGTAPAVGTERGGYRFKGGDPASAASWEKVN